MNESQSDRDIRQRDIVPPEALADCHATVIGAGAIGRQVALQLAAIGVPSMQLIDPQIVETENLAAQGYLEDDLGLPKAEATARLCARLNSHIQIDPLIQRFRRSDDAGNCVFCCVDSIDTRRLIWAALRERVRFFVDGRMSAEVVRVLAAADEASRRHYPRTFFAAEEAHAAPSSRTQHDFSSIPSREARSFPSYRASYGLMKSHVAGGAGAAPFDAACVAGSGGGTASQAGAFFNPRGEFIIGGVRSVVGPGPQSPAPDPGCPPEAPEAPEAPEGLPGRLCCALRLPRSMATRPPDARSW